MIAARVLNTQLAASNKSLERLSTGLRINRASDDPAGLIASEVLRGEKASLQAAIANGQRASQVVATAEGALTEISNLLVELQDMVVSTANRVGLGDEEVEARQLEVDSILSSINRIAGGAEFAGVKLLDGSADFRFSGLAASCIQDARIESMQSTGGAPRPIMVEVLQTGQYARLIYAKSALAGENVTLRIAGNRGSETLSFAAGTKVSAMVATINQVVETTGVAAVNRLGTMMILQSLELGDDAFVSVETIRGSFAVSGGTDGTDFGRDAQVLINGQRARVDGRTARLDSDEMALELTVQPAFVLVPNARTTLQVTGGGRTFALTPNLATGRAAVGIGAVNTGILGDRQTGRLASLASGQANALTSGNLHSSQSIVESAIREVASLRGRLGAFQRYTVESALRSQQVALENISAAESAIRDVDFAVETAHLARSDILVQSASRVLRTANALPQIILQLLAP